ncbi:MAG: ABC transporter ATP-binding protein [Clostridia bacterium]|nr:ABC transporter ATP-binding protein [Clostridia bacterium]
MLENIVELKNINKYFDEDQILKDVSFEVEKNEFLTLLGPSGCGKTTTLRIIAGFETQTSGDLLFSGEIINNLPPHKRKLNTVFQSYALFPHLDVGENIAFGLRIKKIKEEVITEKVNKALEIVNLKGLERRKISQLSGGQQQRVAIARALVNEPEVLLLDEPLGALDLKLRKEMQTELKKLQKEIGITFIYVTHDQEEALTMSDKIIVMNQGIIQQIGTPVDIYNEPSNVFVADFIGEGNIFSGTMLDDFILGFSGKIFDCVDKGFSKNEEVDIVVRPEDVKLREVSEKTKIKGVVTSVIFKGVHYEMNVSTDDFQWMVHSTKLYENGQEVSVEIDPESFHVMKKAE